MPRIPKQPAVRTRLQWDSGGRIAKPMRQIAQTRIKNLASGCGIERRSIHHGFASKSVDSQSPMTLSRENPPRKSARPRGIAFQTSARDFEVCAGFGIMAGNQFTIASLG